MTIALRTFASGDTDYISKMNANVSEITAAINALQSIASAAGPGTALSAGLFMDALFNRADCLIGPTSYVVTPAATTVAVAPGSMYLAGQQIVVLSNSTVTLNFLGQTAGTYYIVVSSGGVPQIKPAAEPGTAYSVSWSGSSFVGQPPPVRVAACFYDATEATASRASTVLGELESPSGEQTYATLDARLEAAETATVGGVGGAIKKVGITLDGSGSTLTTGVKGSVQVDYNGVIVGWSIVAAQLGSITVDVDRAASSSPPAAPAIPNTTTDKISAAAPIQISTAQSAAAGAAEVETWDTDISKWDVIQFNVTGVTALTQVTLYLRILEIPLTLVDPLSPLLFAGEE